MIITEIKITITYDMMERANMVTADKVGVPDKNNLTNGLIWKRWIDLTEEDFDSIENYFLSKSSDTQPLSVEDKLNSILSHLALKDDKRRNKF